MPPPAARSSPRLDVRTGRELEGEAGLSGGNGPDREQSPLSRHALQGVGAAIREAKTRARDQLFHGTGHQDLAGRGRRRRGGDVNRDAAHVVADQLALAGVQASADLDPEGADAVTDGARAADRPARDRRTSRGSRRRSSSLRGRARASSRRTTAWWLASRSRQRWSPS